MSSNKWPKVSPFTRIRFRPSTTEVEVFHNGKWWELYSINDVAYSDIIRHARKSFKTESRLKFALSLTEVLATMDPPVNLGPTVALELVDVRSSEVTEFSSVPCTAEKYAELVEWQENTKEDWDTPAEEIQEEEEEHEEENEDDEDEEEEESGRRGNMEDIDDDDDDAGEKKKRKKGKKGGKGGHKGGRKDSEDKGHEGEEHDKEDKLEAIAAAFMEMIQMKWMKRTLQE